MLNEHRRPGDGLERQPMQSDRAAKRDNRGDAANAMKHDPKGLTKRRHPVNCRTPPSRKRIIALPICLERKRRCRRRDKLPVPTAKCEALVATFPMKTFSLPQLFPFAASTVACRF